MKIIKISTELEMTIHDFPEGTMREQNKVLCELIGNGSPFNEAPMPITLALKSPVISAVVSNCDDTVSVISFSLPFFVNNPFSI